MSLTLIDFFCGAGGSSQGATAVPGVTARLAANHWAKAIESHALNFPDTEHYKGDLHDADVAKFPFGKAEQLRFSLEASTGVVYGIADAFRLHRHTYLVAFDAADPSVNAKARSAVMTSWGT